MAGKTERILKLFIYGEPVFMYGRFASDFVAEDVVVTITDQHNEERTNITYNLKVI